MRKAWAIALLLAAAGPARPAAGAGEGPKAPATATAPTTAGATAAGRPAAEFGAINYAVLAAYLAALVAMGAHFSRREKSTDDYFLAGRRIPWWAAGLSIFGGGLSAITFMSFPEKAYRSDWTYILRNFSAVLIIPIVVAFYIPFYRRLRVTTAYEYLERRFNLAVRLFASLFFIFFQSARMAIVLYLPAVALATVTGIDVTVCIVAMGVLATAYTVMGGVEAVIWTDVLQVVVLTGGALLCVGMIVARVDGGLAGVVKVGMAEGKFHALTWTWDHTVPAVWVVLLGGLLGDFMPNTADQSVVQRYLTTRDERAARRAAWTGALLGIPTAVLFFFLGTALYAFYTTHPLDPPEGFKPIAILPLFVMRELPAGLSGLVVAGIFAAAMSSVDSSMNAIATAVTTDFYRRFRPAAAERRCLRFARLVTLVWGGVATLAAIGVAGIEGTAVLDLFLEVLFLAGGTLAGLFVLGIFTRRANGIGALAGAAASAGAVLVTRFGTDLQVFLHVAVGLGVCIGFGYLISLMTPPARDLTGLTIRTMPPKGHD